MQEWQNAVQKLIDHIEEHACETRLFRKYLHTSDIHLITAPSSFTDLQVSPYANIC